MAVVTNTDASKPKALSANVLYMVGGGPGSGLRAYQDIPLQGAQGDVFVAGGWSSACSVPRSGHPERYRMAVQFYSGSAWVDGGSVEWSEEWSGWHMAAAPVAAPCAFSGVRVALDYQNNYNAAFFDGLFLYREEFGHSFSYDGNGNLLSRKDLTAQRDAATYDAFNNLLTYRQPGRDESAKTTLTYGATEAEQTKRLLRTAKPPLGPTSSF